jgi:hypothetical protein
MEDLLTVLVESDDNQCILYKLLVGQHGIDNALEIRGGIRHIRIMGIVEGVWSIEHVLGSVAAERDVVGEVVLRGDDLLAAGGVVADIANGRLNKVWR